MRILRKTGRIDSDGHLRIDLMTNLPKGKVDLLIIVDPLNKNINEMKYDFSDLIGKLSWKGNSVSIQRELRDEW